MAAPKDYEVYRYANRYGIDFGEDFWLKDGSLIVNYNIYTVDQSGNQRLSYTNYTNYLNQGNCCMWATEGYLMKKIDARDTTFEFMIGDVMMYDAKKGVNEDYQTDGTQ